ncbi:MAG: malate synthase G, partial [Burkholderiaceae bacterium]|nr:malate synthase G [Burkholderiaceae bacterium]
MMGFAEKINMNNRISCRRLKVAPALFDFIEREALPGSGMDSPAFWSGFDEIVHDMAPKNRALLSERVRLQKGIDQWHRRNPGPIADMDAYKRFLSDIGYLVAVPDNVRIDPERIDPEVSQQGGAQLVVPLTNARYVLNAANARWGSLYDALYGSDVISVEGGATRGMSYNPVRGARVIAYACDLLDKILPLRDASHHQAVRYAIESARLRVYLSDGTSAELKEPECLIGFNGEPSDPQSLLFCHNHLHIEMLFDRNDPISAQDPAGKRDIILEAATTTIMDCEDSVSAVDAEDMVIAYRNWLGLMKRDLEEVVHKNDQAFTRKMNADREYKALDGGKIVLPGCSLMFVRNVGILMTNPAILDKDGTEVPTGIMDALINTLIASRDLFRRKNSREGSIYVVIPKLHGPDEVAFINELFTKVERLLGISPNTVKLGIMDEERRTSANLKACIQSVRHRLAFINTGFLDRTGDEIHTSMEAGPMIRKGDMRQASWLKAY